MFFFGKKGRKIAGLNLTIPTGEGKKRKVTMVRKGDIPIEASQQRIYYIEVLVLCMLRYNDFFGLAPMV